MPASADDAQGAATVAAEHGLPKEKMEKALEHLARANHQTWKLSPEQVNDFKTVVAGRVRHMCYHMRLALSKPAVPKWVADLFGDSEHDDAAAQDVEKEEEEEEEGEEEGEDEENLDGADSRGEKEDHPDDGDHGSKDVNAASSSGTTHDKCEWLVGWNQQTRRAWRCKANEPMLKSFTSDIRPGDSDLAPAIAKWSDGFEHPIAQLPSLALRTRQECETDAASHGHLFSGRTATGAPIVVRRRSDRGLLVSVFESGKQIVQVPVNDVVNIEAAEEVGVTLGREYAAGSLEKSQLYPERNRLLAAKGYVVHKGAPKKRPAATQSHEHADADRDTCPTDNPEHNDADDASVQSGGGSSLTAQPSRKRRHALMSPQFRDEIEGPGAGLDEFAPIGFL